MASKIHQRINELQGIDSVDSLLKFKIGNCHELKGDRVGEFAMDLTQPYRLIFIKKDDETCIINIVQVTSIEDYH
ncbi:MAG: hypothetical protein R3Y27_00570 [Clostridia bacterium]